MIRHQTTAMFKRFSTSVEHEASPADGPSVLVLDDWRMIVHILSDILGKSGYTVYSTDSGYEALELIQRQRIDVALVDLEMPIMNGYDFLARLRDEVPAEIAPIPIVITGRMTPGVRCRLQGYPIFDIMLKPFKTAEIHPKVQAALRARRERAMAGTAI